MTTVALSESRIRREAKRQGYAVRKSRTRNVHGNDLAEFMLIEVNRNCCVLGERFDASLEDIQNYLSS
jgi:hypothetical protein